MEWPRELLELFDDPLLDGVRPVAIAVSPEDRMGQKLQKLNDWMAQHGREPQKDGRLEEKMMYATMMGLKRHNLI